MPTTQFEGVETNSHCRNPTDDGYDQVKKVKKLK